MASAQEVVMPHEGHRNPKNATIVQGGNPNCWCVPMPETLGVNWLATTSGTISPTPKSVSPIRHHQESPRRDVSTVSHPIGGGD